VIELPWGSFLEEELSAGVEDPEMNRPVKEVIHMDLCPEAGPKDPVLGIDHIAHLVGMVMPLRGDMQGQIRPMIDAQVLGACSDRITLGGGPFLPDSGGQFQEGSELLAARGKSLTDKAGESLRIGIGETLDRTFAHLDHGRLDGGPRPEDIGWHDAEASSPTSGVRDGR